MVTKFLALGLGFAALTSAAAVNKCDADYCLRALRASQLPTRLAAASTDCSSFLNPTITFTDYVTFSVTSTSASLITTTASFEVTTTATELTTTTTDEAGDPTSTRTVYEDERTAVTEQESIVKRAIPTIPAYASPCSGAVRFTSACACIGVLPDATAKSTTITISTTLSYSTTQTIVETSSVTNTATSTKTVVDTVTNTIGGGVIQATFAKFKIKVITSDQQVYYIQNIGTGDGLNTIGNLASATEFYIWGGILRPFDADFYIIGFPNGDGGFLISYAEMNTYSPYRSPVGCYVERTAPDEDEWELICACGTNKNWAVKYDGMILYKDVAAGNDILADGGLLAKVYVLPA